MDHLHDPNFIKTAGANQPRLFAYHNGIENFYPIDTPDNTSLSFEYFEKHASLLPSDVREEVLTSITEASEVHGVSLLHKEAEDLEVDELQKLASEIVNYEQRHKTIPVRERVSHARKLMGKIRELGDRFPSGVKIPESIDRYGGDHFHPSWRDQVLNRLRFSPSPESKDAYSGILNDVGIESHPAHTIAELLEFLDNKFGLNDRWGKNIHDPYYGTLTSKVPARVTVIVMKLNGKNYTDEDLAHVKPEHLADHFEGDVIDKIFNDRSNWDSLPSVVKEIIAKVTRA